MVFCGLKTASIIAGKSFIFPHEWVFTSIRYKLW